MLGTPWLHQRSADSTNSRARELALSGAPHGTLVTADRQTQGRGRGGRTWSDTPGKAVLMSCVLRELGDIQALVPLAAALSVCEACESEACVRCAIKWPNDILVAGRKLAGILFEGRPQQGWVVVGIGVNVYQNLCDFPPSLQDTATSLAIECSDQAPKPSQLIRAILARLDEWLSAPSSLVCDAWRARDFLYGRRIAWDTGGGIARGLANDGSLLVDTHSGPTALHAGEVHLHPKS
jgi:BirA family transcriptional regulator, biotin operon repressor / biotin---[acetyl-CoA-carboxylase] ligase